MLKTFFVIVVVSIATSQHNYGFEVGYSSSTENLNHKQRGHSFDVSKMNYVTFNGFYNITLDRFFSIKSDLGFVRKGYAATIVETDPQGNKIGLLDLSNEIDIVFLAPKLQYNFKILNTSLFSHVGLSYNYIVNSDLDEGFGFYQRKYKDSNVSYHIGIGAGFNQFMLSVSFENDLTKIQDDELFEVSHQLVLIKLGYTFGS